MSQFFNLTLDTTGPSSGVLSGLSSYYNSNATVTISASDASFMKVWSSQTATGSTSDANYPSNWEVYDTSKSVSFSGQGTQYIHAQFMDDVGNISTIVDSAAITYDTVAPTISAVSINNGDGYTRVTSNTVRVTFSDSTSGVAYVTLSGNDIASAERTDYVLTDADRTAGYKDITITFTGAAQEGTDGSKSVTATVTDRAGNTSASASDTIVLDTTAAEGTLVLRNADDTANLAAYVNDDDYSAAIETESTDIVSYKIWETGDTEPSGWTSVTQDPEDPRILIENLALSSGDGTKEINVKIQDIAGNVTTLTPVSVVLDTTDPVVTLSSDVSVISAVSGYNTVTFSCGATDANSAAGLNYELKLGSSVIKSGAFASSVAVTQSEIEAISAGEGNKSFTLEVTDQAGNTGISTAVVITLDKTAPTGSISASSYYANTTISVTISGSDTGGAGMDKMKVYLDNNGASASWEDYAAGSYQFTSVLEGAHTAHVVFKDAVGNESSVYDTSEFIVDTTAPTGSISTGAYTNSSTITITVSPSDTNGSIAVSGVSQMKVWQDGQTEPEWENVAATKSITLTGSDGVKTIKALFKDAAGNAMTVPVTCTTTLDIDEPDAVLTLYKADGITVEPAKVNVREFVARIGASDTQTSPIVSYKLSGDFDQASSDWQTFEADAGQTYMTISNLTLTTGDALKTITLQLLDAAGNVSAAVSATVTYDTTPPVIDVNAPDYNKVSKQHTLRLDAEAKTIAGKYNDVCIFTWSANEALAAFKVCVNQPEQTAAGATPIGTTGGSLNMTGGPIEANTTVTSTIFGADFAATSAVDDVDGAYEIIVYGQDAGGTWSAIHSI